MSFWFCSRVNYIGVKRIKNSFYAARDKQRNMSKRSNTREKNFACKKAIINLHFTKKIFICCNFSDSIVMTFRCIFRRKFYRDGLRVVLNLTEPLPWPLFWKHMQTIIMQQSDFTCTKSIRNSETRKLKHFIFFLLRWENKTTNR